jgi:hypothetical protein
MREYLFRGKSIEPETNDQWVFGDLIHCDSTHYGKQYFIQPITLDDNVDDILVVWNTVGEYTGVEDKSKDHKKVFEGDIATMSCFGYDQEDKHLVGVVKFFNGEFILEVKGIAYPVRFVHTVIGDIYDTPELLEAH